MRWFIGIALASIASGLPCRVAAQVFTSLDANVASATYDSYLPSAVYTLAPSVAYAGGPVRIGVDGAFSEFETGHTSGVVALDAAVGTHIAGPLRWELGGEGDVLWYRSNPAVLSGVLTPRIHADHGALDAWIGGALGSTDNDFIVGSFVNRFDAGLSYALPYITPSFTVATTRAGTAHYTDVGGGIAGELGRFAVNCTAGTRAGALLGGVATWFNAELRVAVVSRVSLVFSAGSYPADLVRGAPGAHFFGGGIRLSQAIRVRKPVAAGARYNALSPKADVMPDARTLRFAAPANAHVEMMADFTDWQPVAMSEVRPGLYEATLPEPIRSGLHRVNIRVDSGDWQAPAELPPVVDDLGGTAGSLVVP